MLKYPAWFGLVSGAPQQGWSLVVASARTAPRNALTLGWGHSWVRHRNPKGAWMRFRLVSQVDIGYTHHC